MQGKNSVHICRWWWCWQWWRWWWHEQQPVLHPTNSSTEALWSPHPDFHRMAGEWCQLPRRLGAILRVTFMCQPLSVSPRGLGRDPIFRVSGPIQFSHLVSGVVVEWPVYLWGACISGSYKCSAAKQSIMCWKPIIKWYGLISQVPNTSAEAFPDDCRPAVEDWHMRINDTETPFS